MNTDQRIDEVYHKLLKDGVPKRKAHAMAMKAIAAEDKPKPKKKAKKED